MHKKDSPIENRPQKRTVPKWGIPKKEPSPNGEEGREEGKNDKIIEKLRQERMVTSAGMPDINNRSGVVRAKNARLYVGNNSTCTNRRKRDV